MGEAKSARSPGKAGAFLYSCGVFFFSLFFSTSCIRMLCTYLCNAFKGISSKSYHVTKYYIHSTFFSPGY